MTFISGHPYKCQQVGQPALWSYQKCTKLFIWSQNSKRVELLQKILEWWTKTVEYNNRLSPTTCSSTRKSCDKHDWCIGDQQGTRQIHQMDQGGDTHPQGRTTSHEREEGSYQLSHAYDCFLGTSTTYCVKNRMKKWCFHSSDEDFRWKSKRQGI